MGAVKEFPHGRYHGVLRQWKRRTLMAAESDAERKARAGLRYIRLMQGYMPLALMQRLVPMDARRAQLPAGVSRSTVLADSVPCEWLIPEDSPADRALVYLHGGGFVFGVSSLHLQMVAVLAQKMNVRALMVDYRLAPQHPFPAPLEDCVTACRWLFREGFAAQNVVIAGDSAGGHLTLTTLMKLRDDGDPLPGAAACLSPVADLTDKGQLLAQGYDPLLHPRASKKFQQSFVAGNDPNNPLVSPVYGDWHGLPPLLIHAGEDELLRADALRCESLAQAAGVDVRLEIYPRMWHVWQLNLDVPDAQKSLNGIAQFLTRHLERTAALSTPVA